MEYSWSTHDEHCDIIVTLDTCSIRAGTPAREYKLRHPIRHHPGTMCFDDWSSVSMKRCHTYDTRECKDAKGLYGHQPLKKL
jgi:hypothetical protein